MKYVKLSDARANTAALFDEVERGETLIITLGGGPPKTRVMEVRETTEAVVKQRLTSLRDLRDLKKGPGIATIDEILAWRDQNRQT